MLAPIGLGFYLVGFLCVLPGPTIQTSLCLLSLTTGSWKGNESNGFNSTDEPSTLSAQVSHRARDAISDFTWRA